MNDKCFNYEKRHYKNGFFDSFVDATYILTMENSKRKLDYENQLKKYIPTKIVYIVVNKGYKKCAKNLVKQQPNYDLIDANLNIMNHSLKNNYENILILEDDFIFNDALIESKIVNEIKDFFNNNKNKNFYFNLGSCPSLFNIIPNKNIYKCILTFTTHGVIYKKNLILEILNDKNIYIKNDNYIHIDSYINKYSGYFYKIPLVFQTFPETENQKFWTTNNILSKITKLQNKYLNIDGSSNNYYKIKNGWYKMYSIIFFFNYLLNIIGASIILLILYYLYKITMKKNKIIKRTK